MTWDDICQIHCSNSVNMRNSLTFSRLASVGVDKIRYYFLRFGQRTELGWAEKTSIMLMMMLRFLYRPPTTQYKIIGTDKLHRKRGETLLKLLFKIWDCNLSALKIYYAFYYFSLLLSNLLFELKPNCTYFTNHNLKLWKWVFIGLIESFGPFDV